MYLQRCVQYECAHIHTLYICTFTHAHTHSSGRYTDTCFPIREKTLELGRQLAEHAMKSGLQPLEPQKLGTVAQRWILAFEKWKQEDQFDFILGYTESLRLG